MSDKHFRSETTRKHYETQEKRRVRAARRKALKAKWAKIKADASAWVRQNPRKALTGAACVIAAAVLIWLGCEYFVGPGGSIPDFFGKLVGAQENWLIINTAEDGQTPRYHHLANVTLPEGYEPENFSALTGEHEQDFYIQPIQKDGPVQDAYISGAKNMKAADYIPVLLSYEMHKEATEPRQIEIAGKTAWYVSLVFDESDTDGEGMAYRALCFYIDAAADSCVTAMISSATLPYEELPDEAALLAEAETILAGVELVK